MKGTEMKNVIESLRYMTERGGYWFHDPYSGVWYLRLSLGRSDSGDFIGFTQEELREFLKHYEELTDDR